MTYVLTLSVPASTAEATPATTELNFHPMLVKAVTLTFPPGCAGLVYAWFEYLSDRLWPRNMEELYQADGRTIRFRPNLILDRPPAILTLAAYSDDDTYTHKLVVELDVEFIGSEAWLWRFRGQRVGAVGIPAEPDEALAGLGT